MMFQHDCELDSCVSMPSFCYAKSTPRHKTFIPLMKANIMPISTELAQNFSPGGPIFSPVFGRCGLLNSLVFISYILVVVEIVSGPFLWCRATFHPKTEREQCRYFDEKHVHQHFCMDVQLADWMDSRAISCARKHCSFL